MDAIKYYTLLIGLGGSLLTEAYSINMTNLTGSPIKIFIEYEGAGFFCTNDIKELPAGQSSEISVGGCCANKVVVEGLGLAGQGITGQVVEHRLPATGRGFSGRPMVCGSFGFIVKVDASNKIIIENR